MEKHKKPFSLLGIILLIILLIVSTAAGAAFWTYRKALSIKNSIANPPTATPTPESTESIASGNSLSNLQMPLSDAEGKDLPDVPRVPNSIRSNYYVSSDGNFITVDYFIKESSTAVLDYYRKNLSSWKLNSDGNQTLTFSNENSGLVISIIEQDKSVPITHYVINYEKNSQETISPES